MKVDLQKKDKTKHPCTYKLGLYGILAPTNLGPDFQKNLKSTYDKILVKITLRHS